MKVNQGDGKDFEQPEPGSYAATCYSLVDLGTQKGSYEGKETNKRQIKIQWELSELMADGRPFSVMATPTMSINDKAKLRGWLEAWRGMPFTSSELEGFDLKNLLGQSCLISLGLTSGGKIKVIGVSKLPKEMVAPPQVNENFYFSLDAYDQTVYEKIPDYWQIKICSSPEYQQGGDVGGGPGVGPDEQGGLMEGQAPEDEPPF